MKRLLSLLALLLLLALAACGGTEPRPPEEPPTAAEPKLEELCGTDYQSYIAETIIMQMENRMDKTPDVRYFPVTDSAPLTDYAAIDETTSFEVGPESPPRGRSSHPEPALWQSCDTSEVPFPRESAYR